MVKESKAKGIAEWWNGTLTPKQIANAFAARVAADGGVTEARQCFETYVKTLKDKGVWDKISAAWIPGGLKEGKLYAAKGGAAADLSFSRAGTRTRKGATYVEQVPYNLLSYSQDFTNVAWSKLTGVTATGNVATAPDGTLTADRISGFNSAAGDRVLQTINCAPSSTYRGSIWLKGEGANVGKNVDVVMKRQAGASAFAVTVHTLTSDWVKVSDQLTMASDNVQVSYVLQNASNAPVEFLVWGAQIVVGSAEKDYFRTTNRQHIPALDYTKDTCPALSLEPARTNLLLQSESFDNASWTKADITVTANAIPGPDGLTTADRLVESATTAVHYVHQSTAFTAGSAYTFSVYAKANTISKIGLFFPLAAFADAGRHAWFNLATGVVGGAQTGVTASIQDVLDQDGISTGWYRCIITATADVTTTSNSGVYLTQGGFGDSYAGNTANGLYATAAQIEQGSYATSYIPTTTGTVGRVADAVTALTGESSLIGQTEGTLYLDVNWNLTGAQQGFSISDGTDSNRVLLYMESDNSVRGFVATGGVTQVLINAGAVTQGTRKKICIVYRTDYAALFVDGAKIGEDLALAVPACSQIRFNSGSAGKDMYSPVNAAAISKIAISDAQAISLTTP